MNYQLETNIERMFDEELRSKQQIKIKIDILHPSQNLESIEKVDLDQIQKKKFILKTKAGQFIAQTPITIETFAFEARKICVIRSDLKINNLIQKPIIIKITPKF